MTGINNALQHPEVLSPSHVWETEWGRAYVADLASLKGTIPWERFLSVHRKGHKFLEVVEETMVDDFTYRYLVLEDSQGTIRGIQPFFVLRQDLLAGMGPLVQSAVRNVRVFFPKLLTTLTLMVGSTLGEGFFGTVPEYTEWCAGALLDVLDPCALLFGASLIVMKEFPASFRSVMSCFGRRGYVRIPSMPNCMLDLPFESFGHYMQVKLSRVYRKNLRRKFKKVAKDNPITMEVVTDLSPYIEELYPLYLQVYERSALRFEKLTPEYFSRLGRTLPEKMRFFMWRQSGKAIAFSACSLHDGALWDEYLGLDYPVALKLHLYFITFRDIIEWCCVNGVKRYYSTALNYDPKLHLKFTLVPLDLYVHSTNKSVNSFLRRLLPILTPARWDKTLQKFHNWRDLW